MRVNLGGSGTVVCNIESSTGDRGKLAKASGDYATIVAHNREENITRVRLPSGAKKAISSDCRGTSQLHARCLFCRVGDLGFVWIGSWVVGAVLWYHVRCPDRSRSDSSSQRGYLCLLVIYPLVQVVLSMLHSHNFREQIMTGSP
jgi:hypothetical protein